jgi:hypothetical protein
VFQLSKIHQIGFGSAFKATNSCHPAVIIEMRRGARSGMGAQQIRRSPAAG